MTQPTATTTPPPVTDAARQRRQRTWGIAGGMLATLVAALIVAGSFVRVPYVIISPGDATALDERVLTITGAETYDDAGDFLFLTVRVTNSDPSYWRYLFAKHFDPDATVEKKSSIIGCTTYAENASLQNLLMRESQDIAKTVALDRLGYEVTEGNQRVVIVDIPCDGPSFGKLHLADVITAIDGEPVTRSDDVGPLVDAHAPGDRVEVTVRRGDATEDVTVRAGTETGNPAHPCQPVPSRDDAGLPVDSDAACIGIAGQTMADASYPFTIEIDTRRVSGPSAGLAFTLAIIDTLTDGSLTGGRRVAVTGSILPDGHVVPVGGVEQKAIAAGRNGASLMLVPACSPPEPRDCEAREAREHAEGFRVVVVETIDDAIEALEHAGGDPIPPRTST